MRCTPMIVVGDVAASSSWYPEVQGVTSGHSGDELEMLMAGEFSVRDPDG